MPQHTSPSGKRTIAKRAQRPLPAISTKQLKAAIAERRKRRRTVRAVVDALVAKRLHTEAAESTGGIIGEIGLLRRWAFDRKPYCIEPQSRRYLTRILADLYRKLEQVHTDIDVARSILVDALPEVDSDARHYVTSAHKACTSAKFLIEGGLANEPKGGN